MIEPPIVPNNEGIIVVVEKSIIRIRITNGIKIVFKMPDRINLIKSLSINENPGQSQYNKVKVVGFLKLTEKILNIKISSSINCILLANRSISLNGKYLPLLSK